MVVRRAIEGVFALDRKGEIVASSPSAGRMFGWTRDEVAGKSFARLLAPADAERWRARFELLVREDAGEDVGVEDRREALAAHRDGRVFPIRLSTTTLSDDDRDRFVAIVYDLTRERHLERRLRDAEEEERRRIARELHDSVGGQLTGVEIASSLLHRKLSADGSPHATASGELLEHLRELHQRLRAVSRGLLPVEDDPLGLMAALGRLARTQQGRGGTRCRFRCDDEVAIQETGTASNLYHIAEEAVRNAIRHADARRVEIELKRDGGEIVLTVRDDGIGIPEGAAAGDGIGMDSMAQRAALIGASLEIRPATPVGTLVSCSVPIEQEHADREGSTRRASGRRTEESPQR